MKDILLIESVQRKFTKRIPGMPVPNYYWRLQYIVGLQSLEVRRRRTDVLLVYRIMFGMVRLNSNKFFTLRNQPQLRGHKYVINKQLCSNNRRNICLAIESLTYGIICRLVQQILLVSTSLASQLITNIFYCIVNWTLRKPNSITLAGRRQVRSWSQTCNELEFAYHLVR